MKNKFRIRGFVNKNGEKVFYGQSKHFFSWENLCFHILNYDVINKEYYFISQNPQFNDASIGKKLITEYFKQIKKGDSKSVIIGININKDGLVYTPKCNVSHYIFDTDFIKNEKYIFNTLEEAVEKQKYLTKEWIEEEFIVD
jgi:hypothetical protein